MENTQRTYESTFIINASLDDPQVDAVIGRVQEVITKNGGTVTALNKWGRKRLAYTINKKTNGFYVNLEFTGAGTVLAPLERSFQLDEMILRHLTIQLDRKALAARAKEVAAVPAEQVPPVQAREPIFKDSPDDDQSGNARRTPA